MSGNPSHPFSTGYGPRARLYFDGRPESFPLWETRFISYLYTLDKGLQKAILPPTEGVDEDDDFATKNKWAYAQLVQVLDERSLQLIMSDAPDDGRKSLQTLRQHYASTEKPRVLKSNYTKNLPHCEWPLTRMLQTTSFELNVQLQA